MTYDTYLKLLEERMAIQQQLEPINAKIATYEAAALEKLTAGKKAKGFQLGKGRKTRSVLKESVLVAALVKAGIPKSDFYSVKLKGVPDLEKLIKAKFEPEQADKLYSTHIKETVGKGKLEFVGVSDE